MGQKVNPHGLRVGVIKNWDSRWFAKDNVFGDTLVEDYNLRKTLKKQLYSAGVPKIEIERDASKVRIHIPVSYTHLEFSRAIRGRLIKSWTSCCHLPPSTTLLERKLVQVPSGR